MPIYEYRCNACEQVFEEWLKSFDDTEPNCPVCGGHAERIMSNTTFVLKGGGWYVTEYGNHKASDAEESKEAKASASNNSTSDNGAGDKATGDKASGDKASGDKAAASSKEASTNTSKTPASASATPTNKSATA